MIFGPGATGNYTSYGRHLEIQDGRHTGPVLFNISITTTYIVTVEMPMPTFSGAKNPMVTQNV